MVDFSRRTGLTSDNPPDRYFWTDSFAVCNLLHLYNNYGKQRYLNLAKDLISQVHKVLGKHHPDDDREGWLGSPNRPTINGLRIGKPLPERGKDEPYDQQQEWNRDGQYYHYLTKWIYALMKTSVCTENRKYQRYAVDLVTASMEFIKDGGMYWKMSTDLSYPLIYNMGQHDPLDGYVTYLVLDKYSSSDLSEEINTVKQLLSKISLYTTDTLGLGGLLISCYRLYKLNENKEIQEIIIRNVKRGIQNINISHNLAFRELGLAIGLNAAKKMKILNQYWDLGEKIVRYWTENQSWNKHKNINQVMFATSLEPDSFLEM